MKKNILLFGLLLLLSACSDDKTIYDVDVDAVVTVTNFSQNASQIQIHQKKDGNSVYIEPFYQDVKLLVSDTTNHSLQLVRQKYGSFYDSYVADIANKMYLQYSDSNSVSVLKQFYSDEWINELYEVSDSVWKRNSSSVIAKIEDAFNHYRYYFPTEPLPNLYTCVNGISSSMTIDENVVAIGIDKYLGTNCYFYNTIQIDSYIKRNLRPEKIPADLMRAFAESNFPNAFAEDYLLSLMIQCGRYQFFMKCMLPNESDENLWGYTTEQIAYCNKYEKDLWDFFASSRDLLFSSDRMTKKRYVDEGPFTPSISKECPAKIGQWIGFKIVESYMINNPDVTLQDLFEVNSSQEIMKKSKYNPK